MKCFELTTFGANVGTMGLAYHMGEAGGLPVTAVEGPRARTATATATTKVTTIV